jgi:HSP20 family protein
MVRRGYSSGAYDMLSLRDMMGRLMENAFISPDQWYDEYSVRLPAIDMSENDHDYVVRAELPGWKPENIEIMAEGDTVILRGELEEHEKQGDGNTRWHHREMRRTSFERTITLPSSAQAEKATADFENGVLTLRLPKSEEAKPKQIKIGTGQHGSQEMSSGGTSRSSTTKGTPSRQ